MSEFIIGAMLMAAIGMIIGGVVWMWRDARRTRRARQEWIAVEIARGKAQLKADLAFIDRVTDEAIAQHRGGAPGVTVMPGQSVELGTFYFEVELPKDDA